MDINKNCTFTLGNSTAKSFLGGGILASEFFLQPSTFSEGILGLSAVWEVSFSKYIDGPLLRFNSGPEEKFYDDPSFSGLGKGIALEIFHLIKGNWKEKLNYKNTHNLIQKTCTIRLFQVWAKRLR